MSFLAHNRLPRLLLLQASLLAVALLSCKAPTNLTHPDCVVPEPECSPGVSKATGIDTSKIFPGYFKWHIDLLPEPINSDENDNAISFFENDALLSAERIGTEKTDDSRNKQRLFFSKAQKDLHFEPLLEISGSTSFEKIGIPSYCSADGRLYFTAKSHNDDDNDYDLYSAKLKINGSKTVVSLEDTLPLSVLNIPHSFDGQPTLSKDGLMIIFASDRAGGFGGVDLWFSTRKSLSSDWSEPLSLPSTVNTPCDEISPQFSKDGSSLYFSSNGHATIGGYDIFTTKFEGNAWHTPKNIGSPVNTAFDEVFPYELSDTQFFYTSDQPSAFKGRNIFELRRSFNPPAEMNKTPIANTNAHEIPEKQIPDTIRLQGKVEMPVLHDSTLPEVFVRDVAKDTEIARKSTDTLGNYSFNVQKGKQYDVGSDVKDKFYDVHRIDLRHPTDSIVAVPPLIIPDTLVLRINFPFDDASHPYDFVIDDKGSRSEMKWQTSLDLLARSIMNSSGKLHRVILYGHTDSVGNDEYNLALATKRAKFIAEELRSRGVLSKFLFIQPKGRTMPVPRREGETDETYYLRCRRVEFIKVFKKENVR